MDSLGSQAFGSGNLARVGLLYQRSLFVTFLALIPVGTPFLRFGHDFPHSPAWLSSVLPVTCYFYHVFVVFIALHLLHSPCFFLTVRLCRHQVAVLWWYAGSFLVLAQQPVHVAAMAGRYTRRSIPGLVGFGVFEATRRFLQVQGVVLPMLYVSLVVNALHPLWNWLFITKFGWGFDGAPWATVVSQSLMAVLLLTYMRLRPVHAVGTWSGVCKGACHELGEYLKFGVPGGTLLAAFAVLAAVFDSLWLLVLPSQRWSCA